jgi:hypothetical protein
MLGVLETSLSEFGSGDVYPVHMFVPSLGEGTSLESFAEIVAHLRAPDGCPWDKEQTHQTLRKHLLEEAYETLSAIDADDTGGHARGVWRLVAANSIECADRE